MIYEFEWPVRWVVGHEALDLLPKELKNLGSLRPLILTDAVLSSLGFLDRVESLLKAAHFEPRVFAEIPLESDADLLIRLYDWARSEKVDALISLGGGSVLDSGKVLALMLGYGERDPSRLESYEYFQKRLFPHICLPTTAGTGSEAGHGAVIKKGEHKLLIAGPALYPHVAILDPVLTQTLPLKLTVATAMDAWTHSWEALSSRQRNPLSSLIARWTLTQIPNALEALFKNPNSSSDRLRLAEAACLAGLSFTHSMVGLAHSLAHSLAHLRPISHGEAIGVFLPLSVSWALSQNSDYLISTLKGEMLVLGLKNEEDLLHWIFVQRNRFCSQVGLSLTLKDVGLNWEEIEILVEGASLDGTSVFVPGILTESKMKSLVEWTYARSLWTLNEILSQIKS
jgi:alcohol dehydrogenase